MIHSNLLQQLAELDCSDENDRREFDAAAAQLADYAAESFDGSLEQMPIKEALASFLRFLSARDDRLEDISA